MKNKLLLFVLLLLINACSTQEPLKTGKEGESIPNFVLQLTDNWFYNTSDIKSGKPSVFVYYRTHCPYCRAEIEDILDNIDDMQDYHFYLVTVDKLPDMKKFITEYSLVAYTNVSIGVDTAHSFSKHFSTMGVPFTAVYNKDKKLTAAFMGKISSREIKKYAGDGK